MEPTDKQLALIHTIEESLGIKFKGTTKKEAWLWTQENLPKVPKSISEAITDKQRIAISAAQQILGVAFEGKTKEDARAWLSEHYPLAVDNLVQQELEDEERAFKRTSSVQAIPYSIHPDREKVAFLDLVDNFNEYAPTDVLDMQISILKSGLNMF